MAEESEHVHYEVRGAVGVITLDRPEAANAQSEEVLARLDHAWQVAAADAAVKVVVLRATGTHFSAGHDMAEEGSTAGVTQAGVFDAAEYYDWETRHYLAYAKRWRDIPKPSIAAVQGKCIAAGLMLCWPCDLIVAADDARFSDPVVAMGIAGVEYHAHTWELGPRKAKEILFLGSSIDAEEARQLGMVNRVVPLADLEAETMAMAEQISRQHPWALRMAKRSVNHTMDTMGFTAAIDACFDMHHLGHVHAQLANGNDWNVLVDLDAMKARR